MMACKYPHSAPELSSAAERSSDSCLLHTLRTGYGACLDSLAVGALAEAALLFSGCPATEQLMGYGGFLAYGGSQQISL